jgi:PAS domain S-box-containing protein
MSRELNRAVQEEDLLALFVRIYRDLFPGRLLCIKLFDHENMGFEQVYANGRLREESHSRVRITKESLVESGLDRESAQAFLKQARIVTTFEYLPIFEDGITGFDIPLYDGVSFYGLLNLEYRKSVNLLSSDRSIAVPIAHQMCGALRDVRLIAETMLLKEYLEKLLDQANAPVVVLNKDRQITVFNQAIERQTGYSRQEWLDRDLMSFISDSDKDRLTAVIIRVMLGDQKSAMELGFKHADGKREAHIVFNIAPILSGAGDVEGIILVGQDLTEIRNLQKQIIRSEKLATLGQVAAGVAHEVGNPLTSISVYANFLVKKLDGVIVDNDLEKIRRIVEAAARIQSFTRALVTYGRPLREKATRINVQSLLERALSFCEHLIDKAGAEVVLEVGPNLPEITGIMGNLEQVFVNLITNACHALQGGGTIRMTARKGDAHTILIGVQDTGLGIAHDRLDDIFEPFYSTKPEGLGTGLGLSIVRRILTDHGADISVESQVGKGTTFRIAMPVKPVDL